MSIRLLLVKVLVVLICVVSWACKKLPDKTVADVNPISEPAQYTKPSEVVQNKVSVLNLQSPVRSLALSPDDKIIVCGTDDNKMSVWDVATGKLKLAVKSHHSPSDCVAFSPDGKIVASAGRRDYVRPDGTASFEDLFKSLEVKLWDAKTFNLKQTLDCYGFGISFLAFSPDGKRLAAAVQSNNGISRDGEARLWRVETGEFEETLYHHKPIQKTYITSVVFSPDGKTLAGATWEGMILWDLQSTKVPRMLTGHHGFVGSVNYSPDGDTVVSGGYDGKINLWDVKTGILKKTLSSHPFWVNSIAFSPDGKIIAAGGTPSESLTSDSKGAVELWDTQKGTIKGTLKGHNSEVNSIAFFRDGRTLVSGSSDGTVRLWDLSGLN